MPLTMMDVLVRIGKSIGLTTVDLKKKKDAIKALMPEYVEFLKRQCRDQVNKAFIEGTAYTR